MSLRQFELEKDRRSWGGIIAVLWLVFMAIPAIGLRSAVIIWLNDEEKGMRAAVRRQLIEEMSVFKVELDTAQAMDKLFLPVMRDFGFGNAVSAASAAALLEYGKSDFERLCAAVSERIGSKPAVAAMLIPTKNRMLIAVNPAYFPGRKMNDVEGDVADILRLLMNNPASDAEKTPEYEEKARISGKRSEALFGGDFHLADPRRGIRVDVAHFSGTSNVYCAADWASVQPKSDQFSSKNSTALFMALFHGGAIERKHLIREPLGRSLYPFLHRRIEGVRPCDLPRFIDRPDRLALLQAPPLECTDEALWHGSNSGRRKGMRPVLSVVAAPSLLMHPWRHRLPWFDIGLFLAAGGTALLCLRLALFEYSVGKGLRRRVAWGFAFGAMIPFCGFIMIATVSAKAGENRLPQAVLTHMSRQLERLDDGLRTARAVRAKSLQSWANRIVSETLPPDDVIASGLKKMVERGLARAVLAFLADGRDIGVTDYLENVGHAPLQKLMKGFSQDALTKLGASKGGEEAAGADKMQATIDLAHTITAEYMDASYINELCANAPLLIRNPFGDVSQFMGAQIAPTMTSGVRPGMILVAYGSLDTITNQYFRRLLRRSPPDFAERRSAWNIKYMIYPIETYDPPELANNKMKCDLALWSRHRRLAQICLAQRMGREYDTLPDQAETLAVTRLFGYGNVVGVAVALPNRHYAGADWTGAALAIAAAWSAVTFATAFFLTLPFPVFLEATRLTTRGEYDWHLSFDRPDEFGDLAGVFNNMACGLRERAGMARFVSDGVLATVRKADSGASKLTAGGERIVASVLFSDIRGFTTLSEANAPEDVVTLLNDYFTLMEEPIKAAGGTIETYLGDAVLAVFPMDPADVEPEIRAVNAAFGMRTALDRLNEARWRDGLFTIETGIGVAAGNILWGRLGGEDGRLLPMLIGSPADCAVRCEAATKGRGGSGIIVDAKVWKCLAGRFPGQSCQVDGEILYLLDTPRIQ